MTIMHAQLIVLFPAAVALAGVSLLRMMRRIEVEEHRRREALQARIAREFAALLPQPGE